MASSRSLSRELTDAVSIVTSKRLAARSCGSNLMSALKRSKAPSNSASAWIPTKVSLLSLGWSVHWWAASATLPHTRVRMNRYESCEYLRMMECLCRLTDEWSDRAPAASCAARRRDRENDA